MHNSFKVDCILECENLHNLLTLKTAKDIESFLFTNLPLTDIHLELVQSIYVDFIVTLIDYMKKIKLNKSKLFSSSIRFLFFI